jgi:hypothetical protein
MFVSPNSYITLFGTAMFCYLGIQGINTEVFGYLGGLIRLDFVTGNNCKYLQVMPLLIEHIPDSGIII